MSETLQLASGSKGGVRGEAPCTEPAGGLGGAVSPPAGSRGGAPGSYRFSVNSNPFD